MLPSFCQWLRLRGSDGLGRGGRGPPPSLSYLMLASIAAVTSKFASALLESWGPPQCRQRRPSCGRPPFRPPFASIRVLHAFFNSFKLPF